jgi:hypothetical protein
MMKLFLLGVLAGGLCTGILCVGNAASLAVLALAAWSYNRGNYEGDITTHNDAYNFVRLDKQKENDNV